MNAENDILEIGVQAVLLVEDSVRFYSAILPHLFKYLLSQSMSFSTEALNEHERMLRMRGRPKVLFARDYKEACAIYNKYGSQMLGIITDVRFPKDGVMDPLAGIDFCRYVRKKDAYMPIIVESSENQNETYVAEINGIFLNKNSKTLPQDLRDDCTS